MAENQCNLHSGKAKTNPVDDLETNKIVEETGKSKLW